MPNVISTNIYYNWLLIENDFDDNKFADCFISSNADYLMTNDKHFNILNNLGFPKIHCLKLEEFQNKFRPGLRKLKLKNENYSLEVYKSIVGYDVELIIDSVLKYNISRYNLLKIGSKNEATILFHLAEKTWMKGNYEILYEIAKIIHSAFPLNSIDWKYTFESIEYPFYIQKLYDKQNINKKQKGYKSFIEMLELSLLERTDLEFVENFKQGINAKLKDSNLLN